MRQRVLLVGGLSKTKVLAESLTAKGYIVTIINQSYEDCLNFAQNKAYSVIHGDGTNPKVLENAKACRQDIIIAMLRDDSKNLVICELCKKIFKVRKTVALISNPTKEEFFKKMGVDAVVCAISAISNIIEQNALIEKLYKKIPIVDGKVVINEIKINKSNPIIGKALSELELPNGVIIGCIIRSNDTVVPGGDTVILQGDMLIVLAKQECEGQITSLLLGKEE